MSKKPKNRILGIDPGTNLCGFAVIETQGNTISIIDMGVFNMTKCNNAQEKLKQIFEDITGVIEEFKPNEMAIEAPFFGKNVQSMLKLGRAQGVAIAGAMVKGLPIREYAPKKIKLAITGSGNASKEQVSGMLKNIIQQKFRTESLDAADALAVAVCHHYQTSNKIFSRKEYGGWSDFLKDNPGRVR